MMPLHPLISSPLSMYCSALYEPPAYNPQCTVRPGWPPLYEDPRPQLGSSRELVTPAAFRALTVHQTPRLPGLGSGCYPGHWAGFMEATGSQ
ncbi:hypothetical protein GDO81_027835 [Engystomops pustulosus]|uniref:Uncharacterized protein n=1 Tax=Engystomops pustulosus TaxID=76066 RepID=A0AAV6ZHB7_ENGPU|nr:hypothetical protein GDO81_027835 [Engystomops pustulosus]